MRLPFQLSLWTDQPSLKNLPKEKGHPSTINPQTFDIMLRIPVEKINEKQRAGITYFTHLKITLFEVIHR